MESSVGGISREIGLESIIASSKGEAKALPITCIIDSGIQKNHILLNKYVADTYDFSTNSQLPCDDNDGHGTFVAGVTVYGGNLRTHTDPLSNIVMVKGFKDVRTPITNILQMIDKTIGYFSAKTRVFNLSMSARKPNVSLTTTLDDLVYRRDVTVVASAGNIPPNFIKTNVENNIPYPGYLESHPIYFPGDSSNSITVGALASRDSNFCRGNSPSPFTRAGTNLNCVKPDVVEDGGNTNVARSEGSIIDFNCRGVGVRSTSFQDFNGYEEEGGTSFSSPAVATLLANILDRYPYASSFLAKAILISSCFRLRDSNNEEFSELVQGYGCPHYHNAISSMLWRVSYLLQGSFDGSNLMLSHWYNFLFPQYADRIKLTFVCGKPAKSKGYFTYRIFKSGVRSSSNVRPEGSYGAIRRHSHGSFKVYSTFQAIFDIKRGGKGIWDFQIIPHFNQTVNMDPSLKYGCVITVESTQNMDIYSDVSKWLAKSAKTSTPTEKILRTY